MRRSIFETVIGAVVLLVAVSFVVIVFQAGAARTTSGYQVTAEFDNASGLAPGTDVRMSGVKVGSVRSQRLDPQTYFAVVTLTIDESIQLPRDTSARIIADGLLGSNFVSLEPGGEEEMIPPGGQINFTQGAINVVDLLGRFIFSAADSASQSNQPAP
ncbi:MAG TPA: outer membrane lipid asymmetry maintenance protein MlaD [Kiloniellales bacterium]|nr:outer membrane lipid asymmetry maintenance protein MlaD [Kiloniellales bacterium]